MNDLLEIRTVVREFVAERGWDRTQNPKNLAITLSLEAAEVLEHFQWLSVEASAALPEATRKAVGDELADVLMGVVRLADLLEIDLGEAFGAKMVENRRKYPPEKVRGRSIKHTDLEP